MPGSIGTSLLDEPALANDVVRLLGAENQRLKRELHEAQQRATEAEARALVKQEPGGSAQDHAAAERVQELLEENTTLRTQYQDVESRYETEREKRRELKTQIKELKSKEVSSRNEESPESLELRKRLVQTQSHLDGADAYVKELLQQVKQMTGDKEASKELLDELKGRIWLLTQNDPWSYISYLYAQQESIGFTKLAPFQRDNKRACAKIDDFLHDTLKPLGLENSPFIYHQRDIQWSQMEPGYGVVVSPPHQYVPIPPEATHEWIHNNVQAIEGPFELMYETGGLWYYCGTFTTSVIESRNNSRFFNMLYPKWRKSLMQATIKNVELVPPVIVNAIEGLYSQGVLHVTCLVFKRVGFNEQLKDALLEFGKDVRGPTLALDLPDTDMKRKADKGHALIPPKVKKARVVSAQAGPSKQPRHAKH